MKIQKEDVRIYVLIAIAAIAGITGYFIEQYQKHKQDCLKVEYIESLLVPDDRQTVTPAKPSGEVRPAERRANAKGFTFDTGFGVSGRIEKG